MPDPKQKTLITDTSVLINFLNIDRVDLLGFYPGIFLITDHVIDEISDDFPYQKTILETALNQKVLEIVNVDTIDELTLYNELKKGGRLGSGECSAIACAIHRKFHLAIDDLRACKEVLKIAPDIEIINTQLIMISLVKLHVLSVTEADSIKNEWKEKHKFHLKIASFAEIIL